MTDLDQSTDVDSPAPVERPSMESWLFGDDAPLSRDEALEVVAKAKGYASSLYRILARAHERRIWEPLGYESFAAFCAAEFDIGKSRSYQLLNLATVAKALSPGDAPLAEPSSDDPRPTITEAHARPMKPIAHDDQAVRTVWARACEIAPAGPTAVLVQRIVDEYLNPPGWAPPTAPLTASTWWSAGPVWWFWTTPETGVVLQVGVGNPRAFADYAATALFTSKPRMGPVDLVAAQDSAGLLPWVIAELLAGGAAMPDMAVVEALAHLDLDHAGRGPHELDKADLEMTLSEILADDAVPRPAGDWADASRSPVEVTVAAFDTAIAEYHADKTAATRARVEATRAAAADALAALRDYPDEALDHLTEIADGYHAELAENGPINTKDNGPDDLRRFDRFHNELLAALDMDGELPVEVADRIVDNDFVSFNRRADMPAKHVFPRLLVEDLLDAHRRRLEADEVLTGELIQRDEDSAGGGGVHAVGAERSTPPAGSTPGPTTPPGPESGGDGGADRGVPPSPPAPQVRPADLAHYDADELAAGCSKAVLVGMTTTDPGDISYAAQWCRAVASTLESRKIDLERQATLADAAVAS